MTIINTIEQICKRDPLAGKTVTGGIVTVNDSKWQMSFTVNRQQQFKSQPEDEVSVWIYALYSNINGDYIHKPITECSGNEICQEWLYHMGVPINQIEDLAKTQCNTIPVYMPYICYFMPRSIGDRPLVVPINQILKTSLKRNVIRYQSICHISVLILCLDPLETDHLSCLKMLAT